MKAILFWATLAGLLCASLPTVLAAVDFCAGLASKSGPVIYPANKPSGYLNTTWETLYSFCQQQPKLEAETIYYHWSPLVDCLRWGVQGQIDEGEMDFLSAPERGNSMAAGNGFYIARNMKSSSSYGPCATYALVPAGTPILDFNAAARQFGFSRIDDQRKVYLGRLIPFIHYYNTANEWWVTHHHLPLQSLTSGSQNGPSDTQHTAIQWSTLKTDQIWQFFFGTLSDSAWLNGLWGARASLFRDSVGYFQSFLALLGYQDPVSMMRTAIVNPTNPWAEFEPQNFEAYRKFLYTSAANIVKAWPSSYFGIANPSNSAFGVGIVDAWVDKMVNSIIPQIYANVGDGSQQEWREDKVRAGGDQVNSTFIATGAQVEAMQNNPYLYVEASPVPDQKDAYYVSYYYPDAWEPDHWTKIMNKTNILSQTMISELKGCCGDNTTKLLMRSLVAFAVRAVYGKSVGAIPLAVNVVSIHPYGDYNGRSTRSLALLAALEAKQTPPISFIPDFDLLLGNDYPSFVSTSQELYKQLVQAMFSEMLRTIMFENRKAEAPDYYKLPQWNGMWNSLQYFNKAFAAPASLTQSQLDQIRQRDWIPLLDSLFGSLTWRKQPSPSFDWKKH